MGNATPIIVAGLGFGDEGKGATVDALVAETGAGAVVRFNGGQQAAHNVVAGGLHHTFQSYGSGALAGAETWISRHCTVEPSAALKERVALRAKGVDPGPINVDEDCLVTTPLHISGNRALEQWRDDAGGGRHGSTGRGFGETVRYGLERPDNAPRVRHLFDGTYIGRISALIDWYAEQGIQFGSKTILPVGAQVADAYHVFNPVPNERLLERVAKGGTVFEGAQGFWLDENFGFSPHTTWSTTTPANARAICREAGVEPTTVGVLRTYATRHGQGPFPGEGGIERPDEPDNLDLAFAGAFRVGRWSEDLLRGAIDIAMPDLLSVTHLDRFSGFAMEGGSLRGVGSFGVPVGICAAGRSRSSRWFTEGSLAA